MFCLVLWKWKRPDFGLLKFNHYESSEIKYNFCFLKTRLLRSDALDQYEMQNTNQARKTEEILKIIESYLDEIIHHFGIEWNLLLNQHYSTMKTMNVFIIARIALFLSICKVLGLRRDLFIKYYFWDMTIHYNGNCKSRHSYKMVVEWLLPQMSNLKIPLKLHHVILVICGLLHLSCHITFMIVAMINYPHWQARVKDVKEDAIIFIHEVQRYYPVFMYLFNQKDRVICDYYASNHDPKRFRFPDDFYPDQLNTSSYSVSRPSIFPPAQLTDDLMFVALEYLLEYSFRATELSQKPTSHFEVKHGMCLPKYKVNLSLYAL